MDKQALQKHLDLLMEARSKIEKMKVGSAFVTDFRACHLLTRLVESYQDLMAENLELEKRLRIQSVTQRLKKKVLDSKKKGS